MPRAISPLRHLDTAAVSAAARKETRNREIHLPPISVYRWWARRTESVFGAIIDAVAHDQPGQLLVVDPFAGGGVIPLAAVIRGHRVYAQDINPWAATGLAAMLELPTAEDLLNGLDALTDAVAPMVEYAYGTEMADGTPAQISHTFRVATTPCTKCETTGRLFPHAVVTQLSRRERGHTDAYLACVAGHLMLGHSNQNTDCGTCGLTIDITANYTSGRVVTCHHCGHKESLENRLDGTPWTWDVALVERSTDGRREIDLPTGTELEKANRAWDTKVETLGRIPDGRETRVLLRHGFVDWADLYPARQRYVMETLLEANTRTTLDPHVQRALRMAILGAAEMAGHLSRWDRWYLKSYESMAGHRFNLTTFAAEPNVWGSASSGRGTVTRRVRLFAKAAAWLHDHTDTLLNVSARTTADSHRTRMRRNEDARIVEGSSERILLTANEADLILTDPPYHDDVEYDELSLPLRAWAQLATDRLDRQAVANGIDETDIDYRTLMTRILAESVRALKPGGHVIFSYANRNPAAWADLFAAIRDAGLKAAGYSAVHSENETDHAKRNVRACTLDLILDLVPTDTTIAKPFHPPFGNTDEEAFLTIVTDYLVRLYELDDGWEQQFADALTATEFGGTLASRRHNNRQQDD